MRNKKSKEKSRPTKPPLLYAKGIKERLSSLTRFNTKEFLFDWRNWLNTFGEMSRMVPTAITQTRTKPIKADHFRLMIKRISNIAGKYFVIEAKAIHTPDANGLRCRKKKASAQPNSQKGVSWPKEPEVGNHKMERTVMIIVEGQEYPNNFRLAVVAASINHAHIIQASFKGKNDTGAVMRKAVGGWVEINPTLAPIEDPSTKA